MRKTWTISAFVFGALLLLSACGGSDNTGTTTGSAGPATTPSAAFVCEKMAPSLIPGPSGKPQLIYFFRDT